MAGRRRGAGPPRTSWARRYESGRRESAAARGPAGRSDDRRRWHHNTADNADNAADNTDNTADNPADNTDNTDNTAARWW